jgi:hypothetical protein
MPTTDIIIFCLIGAVLMISVVGISWWQNLSRSQVHISTPPVKSAPATKTPLGKTPTPAAEAVSPLIFGTNMSLFASTNHDQLLDSPIARENMQKIHIRIVRMPIRSGVSEATEIQAAQAIKSMGAIPLIILHGLLVADPLTVDMQVVKDMNTVFGTSTVYYEFGNEEDLNGIPMLRYAQAWSEIIPQLKSIALNAHFIGPVSYKYDRGNLRTFLQHAQPRPDEISWHEYDCVSQSGQDACLAGIDTWTDHIKDARQTMQQTIGTTLPIMITEWNYAPDLNVLPNGIVTNNDSKHDNAAFMTAWTTKALKTLAANHVFASMQYAATNTPLPLIDINNAITPQGAVFQSLYPQLTGNGQEGATPAPSVST